MCFRIRLMLCSLAIVVLASGAATATQPVIYGSVTDFVGPGKHPKAGVSGLIIDSKANGLKSVCYSYMVLTSGKIGGQVSGTVERITGDGVERLATFSKMNVRPFDLGQPPPGDDACRPNAPDEELDVNIGLAADCANITTPLGAGDIIRFSLKFKKGSKLSGPANGVSLFGSVVPQNALGAITPEAKRRALERARRMTVEQLLGR